MGADCLGDALQKLRDCGFKLTPQRRAVLELFCSGGAQHLTAQQAHDAIRDREPSIGLVTVYRCLELFTSVGILDKIKFNDGFDRYERRPDSAGHHHHLVCTGCGQVVEFGAPAEIMTDAVLTRVFDTEVQVLDGPSGPLAVYY